MEDGGIRGTLPFPWRWQGGGEPWHKGHALRGRAWAGNTPLGVMEWGDHGISDRRTEGGLGRERHPGGGGKGKHRVSNGGLKGGLVAGGDGVHHADGILHADKRQP